MLEHTTHQLAVTLAADATGPVFVPLLVIPEGSLALESQCMLTVAGPPAAVALTAVLAPVDTALGEPSATPLAVGPAFTHGLLQEVLTARLPLLAAAPGVLGVVLESGTLPLGTQFTGTLALVRATL